MSIKVTNTIKKHLKDAGYSGAKVQQDHGWVKASVTAKRDGCKCEEYQAIHGFGYCIPCRETLNAESRKANTAIVRAMMCCNETVSTYICDDGYNSQMSRINVHVKLV